MLKLKLKAKEPVMGRVEARTLWLKEECMSQA